jgi:hypothetical protein
MNEMPKINYLLGLIAEALQQSLLIGNPYTTRLTPDFIQAQETLESMPEQNSQLALILSAARRRITDAEKHTIALIVGDDPITGKQMSHLVRIRLICAELLNLLNTMQERIQMSFFRNRFPGQNRSGA